MAAIAGGALAAVGGAAGAYFNSQGGASVKSRNFRQTAFQPLLLAFLQAGGDLGALTARKVARKGGGGGGGKGIGDFTINNGYGLSGGGGKTGQYKPGWYLEDGTRVKKTDTVKFGGQRVLISGDMAQKAFKDQFDIAQKQQVEQTQKNFDLIFGKDGPQFLKDKISNRPQQVRDAFGPAVSNGIREAIGGAAPAGTLTTDALLQRVGAGPAMQAESYFQQVEDAANAQQLGLSGVPGFGQGFSADPNNFLSPQGREYLQGLGLNSFQGQQGASLANAGFSNQRQGFQSGLFAGAGGSLAGLFGQVGA